MSARDPTTCAFCRKAVIWARMDVPGKQSKRAAVSIDVERCEPGTGNIGLTPGLFLDGAHPRAEYVSNGTSYRSHRPHCAGFVDGKAFVAGARARKRRPDDGGRP